MSAVLDALVLAASVVATVVGGLRWLRVSQREHYLPGRATRIARLWLSLAPVDLVLAALALLLALVAAVPGLRAVALVAAVLAAILPRGLGIHGRTSRLAWTSRLRRLAVAWVVIVAVLLVALALLVGPGATALVALTVPLTVDLAAMVMGVVEKRLSAPFVAKAQQRLARVRPTVVAITGSYGKTSTKGYVAHLLAMSRGVVASPASFNNRLGLSRAVNDGLVEGAEVFVAEMGTYGPGEIRELCALFPPDIAVITTIGEAHLERMGSRETILKAKSEITERARTVVLPIDDEGLRALAERCRAEGKRVVTCSVRTDEDGAREADVVVDLLAHEAVVQQGGQAHTLHLGEGIAHGVNLGVALGVALALDVEVSALENRLAALPRAAHRAEVQDTGTGLLVIDDTYNANPVGSHAALAEAARLASAQGGRLVLVTPGMVELGHVQHRRNADFAADAAASGAHVVVVGRTNRAALVEGVTSGGGSYDLTDRREQAVAVATQVVGTQGVILYENDLPDHYP